MKLHARCILCPPQVGSRATRLILQVLVHEANIQDDRGGKLFLAPLKEAFPRLKLIWADSGYKPEEGWTQIYNALNDPNSPQTAQQDLPISSDITWDQS